MPFDSPAIVIGKAAPCDEPHHVGGIVQQDSSTLAIEPMADRIERSFIKLLRGGDVLKPFREFE